MKIKNSIRKKTANKIMIKIFVLRLIVVLTQAQIVFKHSCFLVIFLTLNNKKRYVLSCLMPKEKRIAKKENENWMKH